MEPLNFLYLLGPLALSPWQNNEIRYSLRSVGSAYTSAKIFITGPQVPAFLTGIEHIKVDILPDISRYKNMQRQILAACKSSFVPEKLILMNDDFLIRSTPVWDWTPTTITLAPKRKVNTWYKTILDTGSWLMRRKGIAFPLCYEGHTPMPFRKSLAIPILEELIAYASPLQFRTAYGNIVGIRGKAHPNAKRKNPDNWPANSPFWSLKGRVNATSKQFLEEWLPRPSRWEVTNG